MDDPHPALLMFIAHRSAEQRILAAVRDAGFADLTLAQARLLARIGPEGTRLTELAESAQVAKQSAGELVDQLAAAAYVARSRDPFDGRARLVCLAPRALQAVEVARRAERVVYDEWLAHLGSARMAGLQEALVLLREITDPYLDSPTSRGAD